MKRAFSLLGVLTAILLSYALYQALIVAPTEQTMGDVQRIFYHVPSAWTAFILFFINLVARFVTLSGAGLRPISSRWSVLRSAWFLHVVLITGPIWARPGGKETIDGK